MSEQNPNEYSIGRTEQTRGCCWSGVGGVGDVVRKSEHKTRAKHFFGTRSPYGALFPLQWGAIAIRAHAMHPKKKVRYQ